MMRVAQASPVDFLWLEGVCDSCEADTRDVGAGPSVLVRELGTSVEPSAVAAGADLVATVWSIEVLAELDCVAAVPVHRVEASKTVKLPAAVKAPVASDNVAPASSV